MPQEPIDPAEAAAPPWARAVSTKKSSYMPISAIYEEDALEIKEKKPKKKKFTDEQLKECRERKSVFGMSYVESFPSDWTECQPMGWYHCHEYDRFMDCFGQCSVSKVWAPRNELFKLIEGHLICKAEIKKGEWVKCAHSDYYTTKDDLVEVFIRGKKSMISKRYRDDGSSYFKCDISRKWHHRGDRIKVKDSVYEYVASTEATKTGLVTRCECCGNWFDTINVSHREWERGRTMACTPCNNKELAKNLIRAHNYDQYPAPMHKPVKYWRIIGKGKDRQAIEIEDRGIRLFGVEVETELNKRGCAAKGLDRIAMARAMKQTLGDDFVILKEDGSLSMNGHYAQGGGSVYAGFEVVTAPADIDIHRQRWAKLEDMPNFNQLRAWDTETCGMHVHVSKDALTTLQIGRILMFMTHKYNKPFIAKVAGRGENKYCRAHHKEKLSEGINYGEAEVRNGVEYIQANFSIPRSDENRRQAVNITNPRTIEFRIFRGTVHPRHIIRNLEFCDAVCSFCHPGSRSFKELADYKSFIYYCAENRKKYPLLIEWMESDKVQYLPKRNAYGEKDTRGTKRPEVVESVQEEIIPPEPAMGLAGQAAIPVRIPDRAVLRYNVNAAGPAPDWGEPVMENPFFQEVDDRRMPIPVQVLEPVDDPEDEEPAMEEEEPDREDI